MELWAGEKDTRSSIAAISGESRTVMITTAGKGVRRPCNMQGRVRLIYFEESVGVSRQWHFWSWFQTGEGGAGWGRGVTAGRAAHSEAWDGSRPRIWCLSWNTRRREGGREWGWGGGQGLLGQCSMFRTLGWKHLGEPLCVQALLIQKLKVMSFEVYFIKINKK